MFDIINYWVSVSLICIIGLVPWIHWLFILFISVISFGIPDKKDSQKFRDCFYTFDNQWDYMTVFQKYKFRAAYYVFGILASVLMMIFIFENYFTDLVDAIHTSAVIISPVVGWVVIFGIVTFVCRLLVRYSYFLWKFKAKVESHIGEKQ